MNKLLTKYIFIALISLIIYAPSYAQSKVAFNFTDKDKAIAHYNIAINFAKRGELEKALKEFEVSIQFNPDNFDAYYNMGVAYSKLNQLEAAAESYKKALAIKSDDPYTYYNLAVALSGLKKLDEAQKYYLKTIELQSNLVEAHANLAMIYLYKDEKSKYNEELAIIEKLNPEIAEMVKKSAIPSGSSK